MLVFIGLGLFDEKDLSLRALDEARSCEVLFAEFYTSRLKGTTVKRLEELIGKDIRVLSREEAEGEEILLSAALKGKVGFLVPGDPLISTTHIALRTSAKDRGIETRIVHNTSIFSAAPSISGLFSYKFGRSASIPFPLEGYEPESYYDVLKENKDLDLHTLLFLDIKERLMTVNEALNILLKIEDKRGEEVIGQNTMIVGLRCVGSNDPTLISGLIGEVIKADFGPVPHILIVPGKLHFMEEEYLKKFAGLEDI